MENTENTNQQEQQEEFDVNGYLNENGLIQKWQSTGMFEQVSTDPEKFLVASIMEAMIYKSVYLVEKMNKTPDEMLQFQEKFLSKMSELGVFNGQLLKEVGE